MKALLIHLDEQTMPALNRVAAPGKRKRSEFVRQAINEYLNTFIVAELTNPDHSRGGTARPARRSDGAVRCESGQYWHRYDV